MIGGETRRKRARPKEKTYPYPMTETPEDLILSALRQYTLRTAHQLSEMTGLWSGTLYRALARLERDNKIVGEWEDALSPTTAI